MLDERNEGQGTAQRQLPRSLSTHQQAVLIQVLLTFPDEPVGVCYLASAAGAREYAGDFLTIFKAMNWSADDIGPLGELPAMTGGLGVLLKDNKLPPSAEAFRDALRIYEIEAEIVAGQRGICGARNFVLAVGEA